MDNDQLEKIMEILGVNTPQEALETVERLVKEPRLVWIVDDTKLAFAKGLKIRGWQEVAQTILKMIEETTV
jgi:hypothetical protein